MRRTPLLFVTGNFYFVWHRQPLALAAQATGYDVAVPALVRTHGGTIRSAGLRLIPFENTRGSLNPLPDVRARLRHLQFLCSWWSIFARW
jgi:hypothetical protein